MSLTELFKNNYVGINFIRYLLAILVILDHSYHMGAFGNEPVLFSFGEKTAYGFFAVGAFFCISGFLITRTAIDSSPLNFIFNRFLRIWPALIILLILTSFVIAPILILYKGESILIYFMNFQSTGPWTYLFHNIFLPVELQNSIQDIFSTNPNGTIFNGSLWTLPLEIRAYFICFFLVILGKKFGLLKTFITFEIYLFICIIGDLYKNRFIYFVYPDFIHIGAKFMFIFFFAGIVAIYFERKTVKNLHMILILLIFVLTLTIGGLIFEILGISLLVFLIPFIADKLKFRRLRFFKNDISYGTYIYGYLVGQILIYFLDFNSHKLFFLTTVLITSVLALLSWFLIEKPALKLKKYNLLSK